MSQGCRQQRLKSTATGDHGGDLGSTHVHWSRQLHDCPTGESRFRSVQPEVRSVRPGGSSSTGAAPPRAAAPARPRGWRSWPGE